MCTQNYYGLLHHFSSSLFRSFESCNCFSFHLDFLLLNVLSNLFIFGLKGFKIWEMAAFISSTVIAFSITTLTHLNYSWIKEKSLSSHLQMIWFESLWLTKQKRYRGACLFWSWLLLSLKLSMFQWFSKSVWNFYSNPLRVSGKFVLSFGI